MINKIKLKGHESFYIREGWLRKTIVEVMNNPYIFSNLTEAVDSLGIGSNMVKAMRYWLQVIGLTKEERGKSGKRKQVLTKKFGEIIVKNDDYFENIGTLFLLHYKLVTNFEMATSWFLFFNRISIKELTRTDMESCLKHEIISVDPSFVISEKSLADDCNCLIKTYYSDNDDMKNPEDNLICPFTELGLINRRHTKGKEDTIVKMPASRDKLDKLIVLYVIIDNLNGKNHTTFKRLLEDDCNIGKVFNLDKNLINEYIDALENEGYILVNRTAGLNTIYIEELAEDILEKYYSQN